MDCHLEFSASGDDAIRLGGVFYFDYGMAPAGPQGGGMIKRMALALAALVAVFSLARAQDEVNPLAVSLFGETDGAKVSTGVVFIDGLLIPAPYTVSQKGNVIFVNGKVASRFSVEHEEETAASDDAPVLEDNPAPSRSSASPSSASRSVAMPKAMSPAERRAAAAREKAKREIRPTGGFNTDPNPNAGATALFEEADYTYTPPKKPEPKAIPYVRPAAVSGSDRIAKMKAVEAEKRAKLEAARAAAAEAAERAVENFDSLTEDEIAAYKEQFTKRRDILEKALKSDNLIFLSSGVSSTALYPKAEMAQFMVAFYKAISKDDPKTMAVNSKMKAAYLNDIWANRDKSKDALAPILKRIVAEAKKR